MKAFYLLFLLALVSCSTTKVVETLDSSSYIEEKPYSQKWVGGAPGSGSGINLYIPMDMLGNPLEVKKVHFANMSTSTVSYTDESRSMIMARFTYPVKDVTMSIDSKDELSNELPQALTSPVKTLNNEATVEFLARSGEKTVKINQIEEREMIPYPSIPVQ
jgi:hypothetical protein